RVQHVDGRSRPQARLRLWPNRRTGLFGGAGLQVRAQRHSRYGAAPDGNRLQEEYLPIRRSRRIAGRSDSRPRAERAVHLRSVYIMMVRLAVCAAALLALLLSAAPQDIDRDGYAREYVQFQVLQLDQWSKEFPQQFYANLMRPPVDASKLSEPAKA